MKKLLSFFAIILIICAAVGFWGYQQIQQVIAQSIEVKQDQLITIERGTTGQKLVTLLQQEFQIQQANWLPWALKLNPQLNKIKAGTYALNNVQTLSDLLKVLNEGKEAQFAIRFGEGETWQQVQKSLENAPHLKHEFDYQSSRMNANVLEYFSNTDKLIPAFSKSIAEYQNIDGWVYPDTYHYTPNSSDKALLKRAIERTSKVLENAWQNRDKDLPLNNPYEMLILASIVEKESALQAERSRIAGVFVNRLKAKIKLQTDPTVIYGMGDNYNGNIRKKDLETPTPYNTYIIDGLPPTPIANPSESAILAVAHPEKHDFIYFVADGTGGHKFSRTLNEHNKAVQEYLRWYRENNKKK
ncbi:endolytic transglycosylase MltG [Pasteurellaceae bacterium 22721_9_1]